VSATSNNSSGKKSDADKLRSPSTKSTDKLVDPMSPSHAASASPKPSPKPSPKMAATPFKKGEQRAVVKKYTAELPKQMSLNVSDIVVLTNERNGWFQGNLIDVTTRATVASGWFPAMCVSKEPLVLAPGTNESSISGKSVPSESYVLDAQPTSSMNASSGSMDSRASNKDAVVTVLLKKSGSSLGVGIVGGRGTDFGDLGIFVNQIIADSAAFKDGRLGKGDQILAVNRGIL
jgi:hypothetical protein